MAQILHLIMSDTGQPTLWPEDWLALCATCQDASEGRGYIAYEDRIARNFIQKIRTAATLTQVLHIVDHASIAQTEKAVFMGQYYDMGDNLGPHLYSTIEYMIRQQPQEEEGIPAGHQFWTVLQERVSVAVGVVWQDGNPDWRTRTFEDTVEERAAIIGDFIREGTAVLCRMHNEIAWYAVRVVIKKMLARGQSMNLNVFQNMAHTW